MDMPDLPYFLKRERTAAPRRGRIKMRERVPVMPKPRKRRHPFELPKTMDATAWAMLREELARREAVKAARLADLKDRKRLR